jgi:hypothetical protein
MSRKRKVIKKTTKMNLSPDDIEEFRTEILDAGARLADLLVVEYPKASLVNNALFGVTDIVKCFGLEGWWVTTWANSARTEFLATNDVREVSSCVTVLCGICKVRVAHDYFVVDYIAGSDRLHEEVASLP